MSSADHRDPLLLTPGPLTTTATVKQAMLHDWGSRDRDFIDINARVRERLLAIAGTRGAHVCVPLQGSGTFVVEATLGTLVPPTGKVLVLVNGAYGQRMKKILDYHRRAHADLEWAEDTAVDVTAVADALAADASITHVCVVQCETTSGILNPVEALAPVVAAAGRALLVDAMSAFGAIDLDLSKVPVDAVMASSNKCLQGVPGMGFAIVRRSLLEASAGNSPSLSLDLYDQWRAMEANAQWRFTPPVHCIVAFDQALREHEREGGVGGRGRRYRENCRILIDRMRRLGFETLLEDAVQAPIIVTFRMPADAAFEFTRFYDRLSEKGYVIYPGKLTVAESFRIGCIGNIDSEKMNAAMDALESVLAEMGVRSGAPHSSA